MAIFIFANDDCIIYESLFGNILQTFAYTTFFDFDFWWFDSSKNKGSLMVDYKFEKIKNLHERNRDKNYGCWI